MMWQVFYHWPSLLYIAIGENARESDKRLQRLQRLVLVLAARAIVNGTANIYVKHKEASKGSSEKVNKTKNITNTFIIYQNNCVFYKLISVVS